MGDKPAEEIRLSMEQLRRRLAGDVDEVVDATRAMADWRTYLQRYPWICMGSVALVGYLLVGQRYEIVVPAVSQSTEPQRVTGHGRRSSLTGNLMFMATNLLARQAMRAVDHLLHQRRERFRPHQPTHYSTRKAR